MKMKATLPDHGVIVEAILEGFVQAACEIIAAGAVPPFPQQTPVRYAEESAGEEEWLLPNQVLQKGVGDCEDLCIWQAAGMRVTGQDPGASCHLVMTGAKKIHCLVILSDGRMSDPSAQLMARQKGASVGYTVSGDIVVTDHRKCAPNCGGKDPASQYMREHNTNTVTISPAAGDTTSVWAKYAKSVRDGIDKTLTESLGPAARGLANAAAVGDQVTDHFGKGKRTTSTEGMYQNPDTGVWTRERAGVDPLAEYGQTPQAPWGGGYGSGYGYGGDYGYGYDQGYGYNQLPQFQGYGGYGMDAPMLTYADLYGSWELPPMDELYTEQVPMDILDPDTWKDWL